LNETPFISVYVEDGGQSKAFDVPKDRGAWIEDEML